jgi:prepilin-type processing-associated H-X9-DG protein
LINTTPVSVAAVVATASTYMIMDAGTSYITTSDAYRVNKGGARYLPGTGKFVTPEVAVSSGWYQTDFEDGRHFGGVNMAFADGHVKWLKSEVVLSEARKANGAWNPAAEH